MSDFDVIAQPAASTVLGRPLRRPSLTTASTNCGRPWHTSRHREFREELQQGWAASALERSWLTSSIGADQTRWHCPPSSSRVCHRSRSTMASELSYSRGCRPTTSFHPKSLLLTGPDHALLVVGSANMSRNGLRHGVEVDAAIEVAGHSKRTSSCLASDRLCPRMV